jgi:hypothetical protein
MYESNNYLSELEISNDINHILISQDISIYIVMKRSQ